MLFEKYFFLGHVAYKTNLLTEICISLSKKIYIFYVIKDFEQKIAHAVQIKESIKFWEVYTRAIFIVAVLENRIIKLAILKWKKHIEAIKTCS